MITVDARCTMSRCSRANNGRMYRMVGSCYNCRQDDVLILFSGGHEKAEVDCPVCGNSRSVHPHRLATPDEIPAA